MSADNILGPLIEPTPREVSGIQTSQHQSSSSSNSTNPFRRNSPKTSPQRNEHGDKAAGTSTHARATSNDSTHAFPRHPSTPRSHPSSPSNSSGGRPRRSSSLRERYPGDTSHRPLETLTRDSKLADRAPHLRRKHMHGADSVDHLDEAVAGSYHHEGPYDAASLARNNSYGSSPLAALEASNREALRATPKEKIHDAVAKHHPLDGVADTPPGIPDRLGRVYHYREGTDLMVEEGDYKRWPGLDYLPEDLKGKGEPSYSVEKALREHKTAAKRQTQRLSGLIADEGHGAELRLLDSPRRSHDSSLPSAAATGAEQSHSDWEQSRRRSGSGTGARISGELKRRFGSLRKQQTTVAAIGAGSE